MLNNRIPFERLMAILRAIDPDIPLPDELENYLWENMEVEPFCFVPRDLEREGSIPENAYYVVRGLVIVYAYENGIPYATSIYRENTIVALNCFMKQVESPYTITGIKNTLVWSISHTHMQKIYHDMKGMTEMALKTAMEYIEKKETQRYALLALEAEERVLKFYIQFNIFPPAKKSPVSDADIASYLSITVKALRWYRGKLKKQDLLNW